MYLRVRTDGGPLAARVGSGRRRRRGRRVHRDVGELEPADVLGAETPPSPGGGGSSGGRSGRSGGGAATIRRCRDGGGRGGDGGEGVGDGVHGRAVAGRAAPLVEVPAILIRAHFDFREV